MYDDDDDDFENADPHTLARTTDPDTSKEAAYSALTGKLQKIAYNYILASGANGMTIRELEDKYGRGRNVRGGSMSARPNDLEKKGLIFYLGDRRGRSRVMRVKEWEGKLKLDGEKVVFCDP
jgi:anaerobic selenocysteine-containing dehydrogenase